MVEGMAQAQFNPEPGPGTSAGAPQLTVAPTRDSGGDEGLSLRTLVIAALASAAAAIVTSAFWKGGTVISAAITPVIVSIVKEIGERPRDVVRRASAFTTTAATPSGGRQSSQPDRGARRDGPVAPIRTYGRPARRRLHLRVAIVTGVIAFLIAAVVLTVPELVFGGSVASKSHTTFFGGKSSASSKPSSSTKDEAKPAAGKAPAQTPPSTDGQTQPDAQAQPAPDSAPQEQPPAQQAPAPSQPAPSAPAPTP
jgi:hypothetical protein